MMKSGEGASHVLFPMNRMKSGENDGFHIDSHHISLKKCPLRWGQSISGNRNRLVWIKNRYLVGKLRKPNWNTGRKTSLSSEKQVMRKHCYLLYFSFFFLYIYIYIFFGPCVSLELTLQLTISSSPLLHLHLHPNFRCSGDTSHSVAFGKHPCPSFRSQSPPEFALRQPRSAIKFWVKESDPPPLLQGQVLKCIRCLLTA